MKAAAATAETATTPTTTTTTKTASATATSKSSSVQIWGIFKTICLDLPLLTVLLVTGLTLAFEEFYQGPMQTLIESYRRSGEVDYYGYYTDFIPDLTYYGRQCDARDVTTNDSNDLIVPPKSTPDEAADTMMKHGAVLIQNLLTNETAKELRDYLETRHDIKDRLPWDEKFWGDIGRLSLGLGSEDHPIIAKALEEVTNNPTLQATLEGIVGTDPSIVEISTLTTLHGAKDQGIHTDSDFFGSSLLYSRTFLHSYTLFMALQDTTSKMGATTVCPGTHWCANEDLSEVCHQNGAFEVSSNGQTGREVGLLYRGDGMMFNQNIWHRGPKNLDYNFPMNRVMFILTFVSRHALEEGDVRQQGLGTYYYQRWNMWGHTLKDLQKAASRMTQPIRSLKALGLWKSPRRGSDDEDGESKWGIPWLEHFARQLANREDFFDDYELMDFQAYLKKQRVMEFLPALNPDEPSANQRSRRMRRDPDDELWEPYLKKIVRIVSSLVQTTYLYAVGVYLVINFLAMGIALARKQPMGLFQFLKRFVLLHAVVGLISYGLLEYATNHSYLGQRIKMRDSWRQPFPEQPPSMDHLTTTTYPNRNDVLIGTRFDAPYLSSFNHVLEYHPGNQYLQTAIESLPSENDVTWLNAYLEQRVDGVVPRFLYQDPLSGYWSLIDEEARLQELKRQVLLTRSPLLSFLDTHLKIVLADARFGLKRAQSMARQRVSWVQDMQAKLIKVETVISKSSKSAPKPALKSASFVSPAPSTVPNKNCKASSALLIKGGLDGKTLQLKVGDHFLAPYFDTGEYWEAQVKFIYNEHSVNVLYQNSGDMGSSDTIEISEDYPVRSFQHVVQGQSVEVISMDGEWIPARIGLVHPLGHVTVHYENGDAEALIPISAIRHYEATVSPKVKFVGSVHDQDDSESVFAEGQRVFANYLAEGQWFPATIDGDNFDGTFAIAYDDGDYEEALPMQFIRPMDA